jgi:hypothetical protein
MAKTAAVGIRKNAILRIRGIHWKQDSEVHSSNRNFNRRETICYRIKILCVMALARYLRLVRKTLSLFLGVMLVLLVFVQIIVPQLFPATEAVTQSLEKAVPPEMDGWTVRTQPIAETEIMLQQVRNVLRYDEAVYRVYRRGALEVTVYAAHWKPGTASYSQVGLHTHDTCWIYNGWSRNQREHATPLEVAGRPLIPTETGTFTKGGTSLHVMFWHLVGGHPISYDETGWDDGWSGRVHRVAVAVADFARFGLCQRDDQCFVRVTSNLPLYEVLGDTDFQSLIGHLAPLGIFAATASTRRRD